MGIVILFLLGSLSGVEKEIVGRFENSLKDESGSKFETPQDSPDQIRLAMTRRGFISFLYRILIVFTVWSTADESRFITGILWLSVALSFTSGVIIAFVANENAELRQEEGRTKANT